MINFIGSVIFLAVVILLTEHLTNKNRVNYQPTVISRQKNWSEQEETFLRNNIGEISVKSIAKQLNRSVFSIYSKIKRDNLN